MNNPPNPNPNPRNLPFQRFHFTHDITVHIRVDRKIFFHQRIVFLFGPDRLAEIMASLDPIILPLMDYSVSFDIVIFILF